MSERVQQHQTDPSAEQVAPAPPSSLKHCWVLSEEHGRLPGLLLEWRRTGGGYQGRVVRPVYEDGWVLVEEWLSAGLLEPA